MLSSTFSPARTGPGSARPALAATGAVSDWNGYTDSWGTLGNSTHNNGSGSGTCNNFTPTPGMWATP